MKAYGCGYGHALVDGNDIIFTSPDAVNNFMEALSKLFDSAISDLSEILELPKEQIISDYVEENDLNLIQASMKAILKRNDKWNEEVEKTITRRKIEAITKR